MRVVKIPFSRDLEEDDFALDQDFEELSLTEQRLNALSIHFVKLTPYHIKVGHVNFFPTKGTVMLDGFPKYKKTGLDFFCKVLEREGLI